MAKKGNLFLLIKSLTKAEKRHFKLTLPGDVAGKNYLLLFDAIDSQEIFDEAAIKNKFKNHTFVKQLHVTKNYLTKAILKSLRNYHTNLSKDAELKDLLREVEILFKKDLFDLCYYHLIKAEQLAITYERHTALLDIYSWYRRLTLAKEIAFNAPQPVSVILEKEKEVVEKIVNINEYWDLTINQFRHFDNSNAINNWKNKPAVKNPDYAMTLQARVLHHYLNYTLNIVSSKPDEADIAVSSMIEELEKHPERIKEDPNGYLNAVNNRLSLLIRDKSKHEVVPELLKKVKDTPKKYGLKTMDKGTVKLMARTYNIELEYYRDKKDFVKGIVVASETERFLDEYKKQVPPDYQLLLSYQIAYITFMTGQLKKSLSYLNNIINEGMDKTREDIQSFARLLYLIIHFELGNIILLKYSVDSVRRFLKKKRNLYPFEQILLRFFSKASTTPVEEHKDLLKKLELELFDEKNNENLENALDYLDFRYWLNKKPQTV